MVIDDSWTILEQIRVSLNAVGYEVRTTPPIAKQPLQPSQAILQMCRGDEECLAGDTNGGDDGGPRLTLARQVDGARFLEWNRRDDRVSHRTAHRACKERQVPATRAIHGVIATIDELLQQEHVIARWGTSEATGLQIVDQMRQVAAPAVHVPGENSKVCS